MQEEDNQEPPVEINQQSERKPADQMRMDVDTPKKALSVKNLLNEEFNTIPIGCDINHPKHGAQHWTGCYVENCRIHNDKRYQPRPPKGTPECKYCGDYGHYRDTCD